MKLYTAVAVLASRTLGQTVINFGPNNVISYNPAAPRRPFYFLYNDPNPSSESPNCVPEHATNIPPADTTTQDICPGFIYNDHANVENKGNKVHDRPVYYSDGRSAFRVPGWMNDAQQTLRLAVHPFLTTVTHGGDNILLQRGSTDVLTHVSGESTTWRTKPQRPNPTDYAFYVKNEKDDIINGRISIRSPAPDLPDHESSAIYLGSLERQFIRAGDKSIAFLQKVRNAIRSQLGSVRSRTPFALNTGFKASFTNDPFDPWGFISDFWYRDGYLFAFIPSDKVHGSMTYGENFPTSSESSQLAAKDTDNAISNLETRQMNPDWVKLIRSDTAKYFKSNNLLSAIVEDVDVSAEGGVNSFQFFPEEHHLEYLRQFCRTMGGELWAPASQAEYEDIVERKGGVCSPDRANLIDLDDQKEEDFSKLTSFYLNLHRDGYMRPLAGSDTNANEKRKQDPTDNRNWNQWKADNSMHIANNNQNTEYFESSTEPANRFFSDSSDQQAKRARFYTTDNWFSDTWVQMCNNQKGEYHYATFFKSTTCNENQAVTNTNGQFYFKQSCWNLDGTTLAAASKGTYASRAGDINSILKFAPMRFQKFTPLLADDINDFQGGVGSNSVRQKNCVIVKCTNTEGKQAKNTYWEDDDKYMTTWQVDRCNLNEHTGICRIRLNSCTSRSYKCNQEWTRTCGVLTHYIEEETSWLNKDIGDAIDDLIKETVDLSDSSYQTQIVDGFNANTAFNANPFTTANLDTDVLSKLSLFTKAQRDGLQFPTLKFSSASNTLRNDAELRRKRNVLLYYNEAEKAIIEKYLEDIRTGLYGSQEQEDQRAFGDYEYRAAPIGTTRNTNGCSCKCETWEEFKDGFYNENLEVNKMIFRDAFNYIERPPEGDQTRNGAVGEFVCKQNVNLENNAQGLRDESICHTNTATAKCMPDPENLHRHRWFYVSDKNSVIPVDKSKDLHLCSNRCCKLEYAFGDKTRYANVEGLTDENLKSKLGDVVVADDLFEFKCKAGYHIEGDPTRTSVTLKAFVPASHISSGTNRPYIDRVNGCFPEVKCTDKTCAECPQDFEGGVCYYDDPTKTISTAPERGFRTSQSCRCRCDYCMMMTKNTKLEAERVIGKRNRFIAHTQYVDVECKMQANGLDVAFDRPDAQPISAKCVPFECKNPHYIYAEDKLTVVGRPLYGENGQMKSATCGKKIEYECAPNYFKCDNLQARNKIDKIEATCEGDPDKINQPCFTKPTGTCCPETCPAGALDEHMNANVFCWSPVVFKSKIDQSKGCHDPTQYGSANVELYDSTKSYADGTEVICECFDDYVARKKENFIDLVFDINLELQCADGNKRQSEENYHQKGDDVLRDQETARLKAMGRAFATNNDKLVAKCDKGVWRLPSHRCKCQDEVRKERQACMEAVDVNFRGVCTERGIASVGQNGGAVNNAEIAALQEQIQTLKNNIAVLNVAEGTEGNSENMAAINSLVSQVASMQAQLAGMQSVAQQAASSSDVREEVATGLSNSGSQTGSIAVGSSNTNSGNSATTTTSSAFAMKIGYGLIPIAFVQAVHGL